MLCFFPKVFLLVAASHGVNKIPVPKEALLPVLAAEIEDGHEGCRKRKMGQCLLEVRLKPDTGHKSFLCGTPKDTRALK